MARAKQVVRRLAYAQGWFEPSFVIVGTGRSGTGYISQLLTAGGVQTGHELWWSPMGPRRLGLTGDASWCATFEVDRYRGRVFHQIRDPLLTMRSIAATEVDVHRRDNPWYRYRSQFVSYTGDPIIDSLLTTDRWLAKAEAVAEWTWRLEDVGPKLLEEIGARLGLPVDISAVAAAMMTVPRNEKQRVKKSVFRFGWDDLPDGDTKERVLEIAERYGYV